MRTALLLLVALTGINAYAQSLSEKDLLGNWKLSTATMHGMLLDFEAEKVAPLPGYEDKYTADEIKKVAYGIKGEHPFPLRVTFKQGSTLEVLTGNDTTESGYSLTNKNGKAYIKDAADEYEARIAGNVLTFVYESGEEGTIEISFKKQ